LLQKLYHYGFRGPALNFFHSYLEKQMICLKIKGNISNFYEVEYGVPQGSVLGPLLFFLYVNDLPNASKFETTLFADDTNLHLSDQNIKSLHSKVSQEIGKIDSWMKINKLTINYKKAAI